MDESLCPICQQSNRCGNINRTPSSNQEFDCWCFHTKIPPAALNALPSSQRGQSCICQSCAEAYTSEPNLKDSGNSRTELAYPVGEKPSTP